WSVIASTLADGRTSSSATSWNQSKRSSRPVLQGTRVGLRGSYALPVLVGCLTLAHSVKSRDTSGPGAAHASPTGLAPLCDKPMTGRMDMPNTPDNSDTDQVVSDRLLLQSAEFKSASRRGSYYRIRLNRSIVGQLATDT